MLKHPVRRLALGLLIISISACQNAAVTQPNAMPAASNSASTTPVQTQLPQARATIALAASPTSLPTQTIVPTMNSVLKSFLRNRQEQLKHPLPNLMQLPATSIHQVNPNDYGVLADPASVPTRSNQVLNETSLPEIELLQTIGLGQLGSSNFAPNTQFMVINTAIGFGVYEVPSLQQRYFVRPENDIMRIRVSSDSSIIEALVQFSSDPTITTEMSLERYNASTGALIDRQPTDDTYQLWDSQTPSYNQATRQITSPNGLIEAHFTGSREMATDRDITITRLADQQLLYSGKASRLQFSADSRYVLLIDMNMLTVLSLVDDSRQTLNFPVYHRATFSPNSQLLALDRGQQVLNLEQTSIAELPIQLEPLDLLRWPKLDFSNDSSQLNLGPSQWNLNSLSQVWQQSTEGLNSYRTITDADQQVTIDALSGRDNRLSIAQAGEQVYSVPLDTAAIMDMQFILDHDQFIILNEHNQLSLFELTYAPLLQTIKLPYPAYRIAISPDSQLIAVLTAGNNPNRTCVMLFDRASLALRQEIQCHSSSNVEEVTQFQAMLEFSPDGTLLFVQSVKLEASPYAANLVIYRVSDGQALFRSQNALIAPDQRLIVSIDRGQLQLWGIREE
ncbi:hypothetical protein ACP8Y2_04625 [Herpetosiphon llansteffanensis]